jgi:hypothetical protein
MITRGKSRAPHTITPLSKGEDEIYRTYSTIEAYFDIKY